jgi:sporulation related protein
MFQTLKFFLLRTGISLFLFLFLGFFTLYLVHEIALPQTGFDDEMIQWALFFICVFFGFFATGQIGDQRFHNAFHALKGVGPLNDKQLITRQFEKLLLFTESSYFLPGQARRFRGLVVRKYADFLLSIGREESEALKIYLKAFLQNPKKSKFRSPLLSILRQGGDLTENEIDLLMVMLRAEDYKDAFIINHLAAIFLQKKKLSAKTEPVFLYAVENQSSVASEILKFVVPNLLDNDRADMNALRFYLQALPLHLPEDHKMRKILGKIYCQELFEGIDPVLHEKCGQTFSQLEPGIQAEIRQAVEDNRISGRLKKINLFSRDDIQEISRLKVQMGMKHSILHRLGRGILEIGHLSQQLGRGLLLKLIDGLVAFGQARLWVKLGSLSLLFFLVVAGLGLMQWRTGQKANIAEKEQPHEAVAPVAKPVATKRNKVHSIQVAAVTSSKKANQLIKSLKKKSVKDIFIVKSPRQSGGNWYKIRVGPFDMKEEALQMANRMMDDKLIQNYFIVSTPKPEPKKQKP